MMTGTEDSNKWRRRSTRFAVVTLLMGASFVVGVTLTAVGVTLTAVVAARIFLPIASMGLASAGKNLIISGLYTSDSETRLTVLTQLKQSVDIQPSQKFDPQATAWILPALEQCLTDDDPNVVALADELLVYININKSSMP